MFMLSCQYSNRAKVSPKVTDLRLAQAEKGKKGAASHSESSSGGGGGLSAEDTTTPPAPEQASSDAEAFPLRTPPKTRSATSEAPASIIAAKIFYIKDIKGKNRYGS